ncbi:MAG: acetylxylan esterase [Lentisphaeria bacterium]|nr:acetylxylan esterase [Lentisphaeria bacterium]
MILKRHPIPSVWNSPRDAGRFARLTAFPDDWNSESRRLRKALHGLMHTNYDPALPLDVRVLREIEHEGVRIRNLMYQTRPGVYTTASLYLPQGQGPFPGVINLHGHWKQGRLAERVQSRGFALAKRGYAVLSPDAFGMGERGTVHGEWEHHGRRIGAAVFNLGETLMGCLLTDNMRSIDLLCSLPEIDPARISATGASGGGNQTMWLTAMDERIKAAVPVCSVGSFDSYLGEPNCICETLPGGLELTEMAGVLALAAPRAMMICTGLYDVKTFSPQEMLRSFEAAKPVYEKLGAADRFACRILNQSHAYSKEAREIMLGWFDLQLKGIGNGTPVTEPEYTALEEEELMAFERGKRPAEVCSLAEYCRRRGAELREKFAARTEIDPAKERKNLAGILKLDLQLHAAGVTELGPKNGWLRFQLELSDGRFLPLLLFPGRSGTTILFTHHAGKQAVPADAIEACLARRDTAALLDLSGQGENQPDPDKVLPYHQFARSLLWLGRTAAGEWTRELLAAAVFLKKLSPDDRLILHGWRETALCSLYASIYAPEIGGVILDEAPVSYAFTEHTDFYGMALAVPGILKWGDIPLAAALSTAELEWRDSRDAAGKPVPPPDAEIEAIRQKFKKNK